MKKINIGSIELSVLDRGTGPVVLLVHGFPLDHTMWRGQIEPLAERFRVVAPDLRGFGQSGRDAMLDITPMDLFADDLARLLDALNVTESITYCGLSMGGYIAWPFVRRYRRRLGRLILCDTRAAADDPTTARARRMVAGQTLSEGPRVAVEPMIPRLFSPATIERKPELVEQVHATMFATRPQVIAAALYGMAQREDATELLPTIDLPTLVVCGTDDPISPPAEMLSMARAIPDARFEEVAAAGHMSPLEQPEVVNRAIVDFIEQTAP